MPTFVWNESCSVFVRGLDEQHKKLFEIIDTLAESMRAGKGQHVIREVVDKLAVYTRTHFLQEEALMRRTGYPGLPAHQQQHASLMAEVEKYKSDLNADREPDSLAVLAFLQKWLVDHIRKSDKAYSSHMNTHGVQ